MWEADVPVAAPALCGGSLPQPVEGMAVEALVTKGGLFFRDKVTIHFPGGQS